MGRIVVRRSGMLPAVPISAAILPPLISPGLNQSSREPSLTPWTSALQSLAAVNTASKC